MTPLSQFQSQASSLKVQPVGHFQSFFNYSLTSHGLRQWTGPRIDVYARVPQTFSTCPPWEFRCSLKPAEKKCTFSGTSLKACDLGSFWLCVAQLGNTGAYLGKPKALKGCLDTSPCSTSSRFDRGQCPTEDRNPLEVPRVLLERWLQGLVFLDRWCASSWTCYLWAPFQFSDFLIPNSCAKSLFH